MNRLVHFRVVDLSFSEFEKHRSPCLQIISETNDDITGGKVEDLSNQLTGKDKEQYIKMRSDILNLSNVTKPSGIQEDIEYEINGIRG